MGISKASAEWKGGFKEGKGVMKPAHAPEALFSRTTRFEGAETSSNPEELIGAALAGCFSMALTLALEKEGAAPTSVKTDAAVRLEKGAAGFSIVEIDLTTVVAATGVDAEKLDQVAQATKQGCPVGKALGLVTIGVTVRLA